MLEILEKFVYLAVRIYFKFYFLTFGEPKFNKNVEKTINLYSEKDFSGWFKKIRFWDAPYEKVEKLVPRRGVVTELGCGEGIFSNFMAVSSGGRSVYGFDIDSRRIKQANKGLKNAYFTRADVTRQTIPKSDCIVMFHLLHHLLSRSSQEDLIAKGMKSLKKGGKLIIVEINNEPFLKYIFTYLVDHVLIAWLFERKLFEPNIYFRKEKEWCDVFKKNHLTCKTYKAAAGKPFSHIIFECSMSQTR